MADRRPKARDRRVVIINQTGGGGSVGPVGPVGPPGSSDADPTVLAGEALSGHKAVFVADDGKAYLANPTLATCRLTMGVTLGAITSGASGPVKVGGVLEEVSWAWNTSQLVWLGASGALTQILPTTGHLLQVGTPVGPTKLRIEPQLIAFLG